MRELEIFKELYEEILKKEEKKQVTIMFLDEIQLIAYKWFLNNYPTVSIHKINIIVETIHELKNMR